MIIGIDASRSLRAQRTGTENYSHQIVRHLLELPQAQPYGWRLYVPTMPPGPLRAHYPQDAPWRVVAGHRLWTHRALAWEILRNRPERLFVPAHVVPFLPPALLPHAVVTIHDLGYRHFPQTHTFAQRIYLEISTRWSCRAASRIISVSYDTAKDLKQIYNVDPEKISVIHEAPGRKPAASFNAGAVNFPRPYALYLGTIQPRKNLARLVRAYAQLYRIQDPGWDLVLAGRQGWLGQDLAGLAGELGVARHVHLPGYVAEEAISDLLSNACFFAFPSLFEGFGLPLLEAQQMGVPVMTSNNSALPEVGGKGALYVDPSDTDALAQAMLRLSQDEALRQDLIAAGYENLQRFSWEKAAEQTLDVLLNAAKSGQ